PHGDRSPRPPDVGESLSERARKHARDPGRRRIAGVRPQRAHVDFYAAHRARKRESVDPGAGAGKGHRAEDAERGAAHNLECRHRNLRVRAWSSARGKPPPAVYELGTASEDSDRRAVIPGWRGNLLSRSGAEGDRRARFYF